MADTTAKNQEPDVEDRELEGVVTMLARYTAGLPDANVDPGQIRTIGQHGVGANAAEHYVNPVFALRDYCWCDDDDGHLGVPGTVCPPNFEHFASGITATWYKYLGRDLRFSREALPGEALGLLIDCVISLPIPASQMLLPTAAHKRAWGWSS